MPAGRPMISRAAFTYYRVKDGASIGRETLQSSLTISCSLMVASGLLAQRAHRSRRRPPTSLSIGAGQVEHKAHDALRRSHLEVCHSRRLSDRPGRSLARRGRKGGVFDRGGGWTRCGGAGTGRKIGTDEVMNANQS
jgi:hypothetical protein